MPNGTVKFFNTTKGFGFITPDDGGKDVFVTKTSVSSSGLAELKPSSRISFEVEPDTKGPKAIHLKVLADPPPQAVSAVRPTTPPAHESSQLLTIYLDSHTETSRTVLADLLALGHEPRILDYMATPPSIDQLKALSILLQSAGQNLVQKYAPLFQELRLDDRFISESEFWTGVFEHPSLINGPILATSTKAIIFRTGNSIGELLGYLQGGDVPAPVKSKKLAQPASDVTIETVKAAAPTPKVAAEKIVKKPKKVKVAIKRTTTKLKAAAASKALPKGKTKATARKSKPAKAGRKGAR